MGKTLLFGKILTAVLFASLFGIQNTNAAITSELGLGSGGSDVVELQTYFAADAALYPSGLVTGYFGPLTEAATQRFQTAKEIVSGGTPETTGYGRVGPQTMMQINALISSIQQTPNDNESLETRTQDGSVTLTKNAVLPKQQLASAGSTAHLVEATEKEIGAGKPVRLKIPKISVDSAVDHVGLTPGGAMDISENPGAVAWFDLGMRPGESGSAVIAGHYGWQDGRLAIFDHLHTLQKGDSVYVEDEDGTTVTFVVRESRWYAADADAIDVFSSHDGQAYLNIITCGGVWDEAKKSYAERLVVFTDRIYE